MWICAASSLVILLVILLLGGFSGRFGGYGAHTNEMAVFNDQNDRLAVSQPITLRL